MKNVINAERVPQSKRTHLLEALTRADFNLIALDRVEDRVRKVYPVCELSCSGAFYRDVRLIPQGNFTEYEFPQKGVTIPSRYKSRITYLGPTASLIENEESKYILSIRDKEVNIQNNPFLISLEIPAGSMYRSSPPKGVPPLTGALAENELADLNLSGRASNSLVGLVTLEQLRKLEIWDTDYDVHLRSFGKTCRREVREKLSKLFEFSLKNLAD